MQIAQLDAGLLIVFAFSGMTIIGAMLAGWSSANKFSLLGGLRAGSQMISYELVMGLTVLGLILIFGTVDLGSMVRQQSGVVLGFLPAWGVVYQPFAAVLFLTAAIAENKRIPFDLPEAESELIAGYYTEYSAMKMGLFMFAEFIEIAIVGALFTTLFLGGYNLPYMNDGGFTLPGGATIAMSHGAVVVTQLVVFLRQGDAGVQLPDPDALDAAALPLRPGAGLRVEVHAAAGAGQPVPSPPCWCGRTRERRCEDALQAQGQYWNEPTLTLWERAYLPEILRGLVITSGVFLRNMKRWMTGKKGALTTYYPEETRADYAPLNRGKHVLTQRPDGKPQCIACNMCATVCPAKVIEIEAGFDPTDTAHPKYPAALRDRLLALHLLRPVRRGLPRGRDPHGQGNAGPAVRRPAPDVAHARRDADLAAAERRRQALPGGRRRQQDRGCRMIETLLQNLDTLLLVLFGAVRARSARC